MVSLTLAAAILSLADIQAAIGADPAMCRVVRFTADGARTEQAPTRPFRPSAGRSVSVRSSGSGGSATSVSSSSASSGGSATSSSRVVRDGVAITFDQDKQGCRVVIDERPAQGAER